MVTSYVYSTQSGTGGRLLEKDYFDSLAAYTAWVADPQALQPAELVQYTYNAFGRTVKVLQDADGDLATTADQRITEISYDAQGRVLSESSPEGMIHYEYAPITGLQTRTWTGTDSASPTTDTRYAYDTLGRLDQVTVHARNGQNLPAADREATDYVYDLLGNLKQTRLPNGVVSDYTYDQLNRLTLLREFKDANHNHLYDVRAI